MEITCHGGILATKTVLDTVLECGARLALPLDLAVPIHAADALPSLLYLDTNYNSSFALMHEDHQDDALALELG
ncbi:MAG: hypothetical protein HC788_14570, partial [Sphingopyxis sp.]|nr:hypothetical protein [Sphingopyxis sp.]